VNRRIKLQRVDGTLIGYNIELDLDFPKIVCLCGSTRFKDAFNVANLALTLAGYIVLSVGSFTHSDAELNITEEMKVKLDHLHKRKIDLADVVLVLNVEGYIGFSTRSEIIYAEHTSKPVGYAYGVLGENGMDVVTIVSTLLK